MGIGEIRDILRCPSMLAILIKYSQGPIGQDLGVVGDLSRWLAQSKYSFETMTDVVHGTKA